MNYQLTAEQLTDVSRKEFQNGMNAAIAVIEAKAIELDDMSSRFFDDEKIDLSIEYAMRASTLCEILDTLEPEFRHIAGAGRIARILA